MAGTRSSYRRTISLCPEDLDFVEKPPKQLVVECPICMGLLFNPHIVSCCGHHFCEVCLQKVKDECQPCPMCKSEFSSLCNKALQRDINQLEVRCPNKNKMDEKGCQWTGDLGLLEGHLNIGERMGQCDYTVVGCMYGCGHSDKRGALGGHELLCPKRPYSCDYCGEYESTCEDVTERHWKECSQYIIECPNLCKKRYLARATLQNHLANECELQIVACNFSWAGCKVQVQRSKLEEHEDTSITAHLQKVCLTSSNLMSHFQELSESVTVMKTEKKESDSLLAKFQQEDIRNKHEIEKLNTNVTTLKQKIDNLYYENETLKQQLNKMYTESKAEKEVLARRSFSLESGIGVPPYSFVLNNFQQRMAHGDEFYSHPFYSHIGGYRMCIKVTPKGIFFGEGTHVSLTVYIMKGVFDDYLKWPFRGTITIALLDLTNDSNHRIDSLTFDKGTSIKVSGRVTNGDINQTGLVLYEFVDHAWLKPSSKMSMCYVKDNSLTFKVLNVSVNTSKTIL